MKPRGETYSAYLVAELEREDKRRESIDARSSATVSASLAVLALTGVVSAVNHGPAIGSRVTGGVSLFVAAFLVAVLLAIGALAPRRQGTTSLRVLSEMVRRGVTDDEQQALRVCAIKRLEALDALRQSNNRKIWFLLLSQTVQFVGVIALALSLGILGRFGPH